MSKLPTFGFKDHLTAVFAVPATLAVNCADWPADSAAGPGKIETLTFVADSVTNEIGCDHRLSEAAANIANRAVTDMN